MEEGRRRSKVQHLITGGDMSAGAIDIIYGGAVPDETKKVNIAYKGSNSEKVSSSHLRVN